MRAYGKSLILAGMAVVLTLGLQRVGLGQQSAAKTVSEPARKPYTAHFKITKVQTLGNGTTITSESTEVMALDSQGRHYSLRVDQLPSQRVEQRTGTIDDRVAKTQTRWSSADDAVYVTARPGGWAPGEGGCWSTDPEAGSEARQQASHVLRESVKASQEIERKETVFEELGARTIQGVEALGVRWTRTIPAGQEGNDAAIVISQETWHDKELGMVVLQVRDDPRTSKETRELVSLEWGEPDAAAFQAPEEYRVVHLEMHQVPCMK